MEIYYFDFYQQTDSVKFYERAFSMCDGCAIIKGDTMFIFFRVYQKCLDYSVKRIETELKKPNSTYSYSLSDLIQFLQKHAHSVDARK
jgi:hypothetical protein